MTTISNISDKFNAKAINNFIRDTYKPTSEEDYGYICMMLITAVFALFKSYNFGDKELFKQFVNGIVDKVG